MTALRKKHYLIKILIVCGIIVILNGMFGATMITRKYFDFTSCKIRTEVSFLFIPISKKWSDTIFSAYGVTYKDNLKNKEVTVNIDVRRWPDLMPGRPNLLYICYKYGPIPCQMSEINQYWDYAETPREEREKNIATILKLWAESGNCRTADEYIEGLNKEAVLRQKQKVSEETSPKDMPGK